MTPSNATRAAFALFAAITSLSFLYTGEQHTLYALTAVSAIAVLLLNLYVSSSYSSFMGLPGSLLALFFLWTAVAVSWSEAPHVSIVELGSLATGFAVYLALKLNIHTEVQQNLDRLLLAFGALIAVHITIQAATGMTPESHFLNPNSAAGYLNLIWPVAAVGLLSPETQRRNLFLYSAAILISMIAIGSTGSRGAMIGAIAALAILSLAGSVVLRQVRQTGFLVALAAIGLGVANVSGGGEVASGIQSMTDPGSAGATRFAIWSATWDMIQTSPWLGHGPGVFYLMYPAFRLTADRSAGYFVHNDYLEFWFDRGIIGLVLFLAVGVATIYLATKLLRRVRREHLYSPNVGAGIAAITALTTLAVHGLFSYSFQMMPFLVIAGIRLAQLENALPEATMFRIPLPDIRGRPLSIFGLFVLFGLSAWSLGSYVLYFERVDDGQRQAQLGNYAAAADNFARARAAWSLNDSAWYLQANVHYMALQNKPSFSESNRAHLVQRALELLDHAESRNTLQPAAPLLRGLFRANYPELAPGSAVDSFRHALALNPRTIEARYALSQIYERQGLPDMALATAREGLELTYAPGTDISPLVRRVHNLQNGEPNHAGNDTLGPSDTNEIAPDPAR